MNDVLKTIQLRRTIRRFTSDPLDPDKVDAVLEAGRWAPSFSNLQPWRFVVVHGKRLKNELDEAAGESVLHLGMKEAAVIVVVCVDGAVDSQHGLEAGAAATQNMALAACSLGLGAGWIGVWGTRAEKSIQRLLQLPEKTRVVSLLPMGVPRESPEGKRKPLKTFVEFR